jgi:SAM-dependent methyltransferase
MARYLHGHDDSVLASHRVRTPESSAPHLLPHLAPDWHLLDVGCGPASITKGLLGHAARVIGLDRATGLLGELETTPGLAFVAGDATALPFGDASFDVVHAHQVLQHLADPVAAITEARRVARRLVSLAEADYAAMLWWPRSSALDEWMAIYQAIAERERTDPNIGRRLGVLAAEVGFPRIEVASHNWTYATPETRRWWADGWARRVLESSYATLARAHGLATDHDLAHLSEGWRAWGEAPHGIFVIMNVTVLAWCAEEG